MLDGMFTCRGGEDLSGGTLDVRCELGVERGIVKCRGSIGLEGAMPTAVPASSWRLADGSDSEARRTLFYQLLTSSFKRNFGQKKRRPVRGGGPTMLISLRSIYNPTITESLILLRASLGSD